MGAQKREKVMIFLRKALKGNVFAAGKQPRKWNFQGPKKFFQIFFCLGSAEVRDRKFGRRPKISKIEIFFLGRKFFPADEKNFPADIFNFPREIGFFGISLRGGTHLISPFVITPRNYLSYFPRSEGTLVTVLGMKIRVRGGTLDQGGTPRQIFFRGWPQGKVDSAGRRRSGRPGRAAGRGRPRGGIGPRGTDLDLRELPRGENVACGSSRGQNPSLLWR